MKKQILLSVLLMTLAMNAQSIPKDKQKHFAAGVVTGVLSSIIVKDNPLKIILSSVIVGVGKEVYDHVKHKTFDFKDATATILGGVTVAVTIKIF